MLFLSSAIMLQGPREEGKNNGSIDQEQDQANHLAAPIKIYRETIRVLLARMAVVCLNARAAKAVANTVYVQQHRMTFALFARELRLDFREELNRDILKDCLFVKRRGER